MIANLGRADRIVRLLLGALLVVAPLLNLPAIWTSPLFAYASILVGMILAVTAVFRFCPLYRILGVSTCAR